MQSNAKPRFKAVAFDYFVIFDANSVIPEVEKVFPGKGVEYMEYNYLWHGTPPGKSDIAGAPPKDKQAAEALKELRTLGGKIRSEHE